MRLGGPAVGTTTGPRVGGSGVWPGGNGGNGGSEGGVAN